MEIIAGYKATKQNAALFKIFSEGFPDNHEVTRGLENLLKKKKDNHPAVEKQVASKTKVWYIMFKANICCVPRKVWRGNEMRCKIRLLIEQS